MTEPLAYTNKIPGDQTSTVVPVETFTPAQLATQRRVEVIEEILNGMDAFEGELKKIRKECSHHVFTDTAGFPYDVRMCAICGTSMGLV